MIPELLDNLPDAASRIPAGAALAAAGFGLIIALLGARLTRPIISLSLVSAGTVIGLQMPKWFGWGIDPMGTAFGMAIVLGISGYMLTALWEGICFSTVLATIAGVTAWMRLAPHQPWHIPAIDWSRTALEIASNLRLSLPPALTTVLPIALGIGATVGALLMVIWQKLGRVLFYSLLGLGIFSIAGVIGAKKMDAGWLGGIPEDPWIQVSIFALATLLAAGIQWILLPKEDRPSPPATSGNKLHLNQFVAKGPAMRVAAAEGRVLVAGVTKGRGAVRAPEISARIR